MSKQKTKARRSPNMHFLLVLCRASAGSIIFALPLLMTMEMWQLGEYMAPLRLGLFLLITFPLLIGCSHVVGFEATFDWRDDVVDVLVAYFVSFLTSLAVLSLLAMLDYEKTPMEWMRILLLQMIPGSFGALLAQGELTAHSRVGDAREERESNYASEIFLIAAGALFLSFSIAPTEEVVLIAQRMSQAQALTLSLICLLVMHAFVYALDFRGSAEKPKDHGHVLVFLKFTVVGYALSLLISAYILWTFQRADGLALAEYARATIVLGFPATVGAAAARLII